MKTMWLPACVVLLRRGGVSDRVLRQSNPLSRLVSNLSKKELLERSVDEVVTNSVPLTLTVREDDMTLVLSSKVQHRFTTRCSLLSLAVNQDQRIFADLRNTRLI